MHVLIKTSRGMILQEESYVFGSDIKRSVVRTVDRSGFRNVVFVLFSCNY
jgi:hypothetical protein